MVLLSSSEDLPTTLMIDHRYAFRIVYLQQECSKVVRLLLQSCTYDSDKGLAAQVISQYNSGDVLISYLLTKEQKIYYSTKLEVPSRPISYMCSPTQSPTTRTPPPTSLARQRQRAATYLPTIITSLADARLAAARVF